jgi:hypothetical protein
MVPSGYLNNQIPFGVPTFVQLFFTIFTTGLPNFFAADEHVRGAWDQLNFEYNWTGTGLIDFDPFNPYDWNLKFFPRMGTPGVCWQWTVVERFGPNRLYGQVLNDGRKGAWDSNIPGPFVALTIPGTTYPHFSHFQDVVAHAGRWHQFPAG